MPDSHSLSLEQILGNFTPGIRGRKPIQLPTLRDANGRVLPRYVTEKHLGMRRTNGAMKLKRLTTHHLRLIGMHLEGKSLEQIALQANCTISTVSRILNDPLAQQILKRIYEDRQGEIQALAGPAINAVREALDREQPIGVKLRAVDKYAKIREVMLDKDKGNESAEDVIARMLDRMNINAENVQININTPEKE